MILVLKLGSSVGCLSPSGVWIVPSGSMKACPQGGGFLVSSSPRASGSCIGSAWCLQQQGLTFHLWRQERIIACNVLEVSWTNFNNSQKGDSDASCWRFCQSIYWLIISGNSPTKATLFLVHCSQDTNLPLITQYKIFQHYPFIRD